MMQLSAPERLKTFLRQKNNDNSSFQPLTPDASTRDYFRINWEDSTAIACVYAESFKAQEQSFLDVSNLFVVAGLPVAEIYDFDENLGVIIHEDFGDDILRPILESAAAEQREMLINQAIKLIAEIQSATPKAFELNSIAARLAFDEEKLNWEFDFFTEHYFTSLRRQPLAEVDTTALKSELSEVSAALAARVKVLCHRDFHAANLMIDHAGRLRIIDHQDARMGTMSYDLVSLLLDRVLQPPPIHWLREKQLFLLEERRKLGLEEVDAAEFAGEFRLQTIQRCLKAIGTFSFQTAKRGKTGYTQFINPMFQIVREAAQILDRFPHLQTIINQILDTAKSIDDADES